MQGNIISLFADSSSYGFRYHSYKRNEKYCLVPDRVSLHLSPAEKTHPDTVFQTPILALIERTEKDMRQLSEEEGAFLDKFEQLLRILYRFNCYNPELILQYQEIFFQDSSNREDQVLSAFHELASLVKDLLKKQARRDGVIHEEDGMDQLILFMLEEVLKLYQADLISCCQSLVERDSKTPFPSEEDMVNRYYKPIAEQLKGLIAS